MTDVLLVNLSIIKIIVVSGTTKIKKFGADNLPKICNYVLPNFRKRLSYILLLSIFLLLPMAFMKNCLVFIRDIAGAELALQLQYKKAHAQKSVRAFLSTCIISRFCERRRLRERFCYISAV